ncbi:retrovirus-related pol polyprotein from transposon TNT 1-94 [Tanacetum coccineum]|uniref:Retrovirus-related pol polyprotein from transposon TNT 1-94 n=1 Tax=Tanacetum coccineum TaxID=301880 RepID=A0ABQ5IMG2_9ASTR
MDAEKEGLLKIVEEESGAQVGKSKDEAPEVIKTFLKRITVLLQSPVIIIRTDNGTEFKNQILKEYFDSVGISHQASSVRTPQQNGVVERRNRMLVEAARTMLLFSRASLHATLKTAPSFTNDREDIGKLGAKGDIGFFIGYSADSCAYRVYNRRTKKIMETMNVTFDELSAMAFEQSSSKPGLQSMTSGQISSGLDLTYAPSTITTQKPTEACDPIGTPMEIKDKLDLDQNGSPVDATKYRSMIGALMYLTSSRPDIVHATCLCARYQAKPTEKHLKEVKRIFRYLRGTVNTGLWYSKDSGIELTGFSDADYAGCKDTFKSTSGGAQFLGEKLVSWSSKKQDCTALSTAEAEYVSLSVCCAQVLWMRTQLTDYGFHFNKIPIYCDSKSAIAISCNPVQHSRTKHIAVRYHFIKEHVEKYLSYFFLAAQQTQQQ